MVFLDVFSYYVNRYAHHYNETTKLKMFRYKTNIYTTTDDSKKSKLHRKTIVLDYLGIIVSILCKPIEIIVRFL